MGEDERAVLLARGERTLNRMERAFDKSLQKKDPKWAWAEKARCDGAVFMLESLGLITPEDSVGRSEALRERFMEAYFPKEAE